MDSLKARFEKALEDKSVWNNKDLFSSRFFPVVLSPSPANDDAVGLDETKSFKIPLDPSHLNAFGELKNDTVIAELAEIFRRSVKFRIANLRVGALLDLSPTAPELSVQLSGFGHPDSPVKYNSALTFKEVLNGLIKGKALLVKEGKLPEISPALGSLITDMSFLQKSTQFYFPSNKVKEKLFTGDEAALFDVDVFREIDLRLKHSAIFIFSSAGADAFSETFGEIQYGGFDLKLKTYKDRPGYPCLFINPRITVNTPDAVNCIKFKVGDWQGVKA